MIRATLTAIPSRVHVLAAKVLTTVAVVALAAVACVAVAAASMLVFGLGLSITDMMQFFGIVPFGPVGGGLVMGSYVAGLLVLSYWASVRRDA